MQTMQTNKSEPGFQIQAADLKKGNDGLMDVDMMDVAELERERGDPRREDAVKGQIDQEEDELARVRL